MVYSNYLIVITIIHCFVSAFKCVQFTLMHCCSRTCGVDTVPSGEGAMWIASSHQGTENIGL